jgi:hypothetical protein
VQPQMCRSAFPLLEPEADELQIASIALRTPRTTPAATR